MPYLSDATSTERTPAAYHRLFARRCDVLCWKCYGKCAHTLSHTHAHAHRAKRAHNPHARVFVCSSACVLNTAASDRHILVMYARSTHARTHTPTCVMFVSTVIFAWGACKHARTHTQTHPGTHLHAEHIREFICCGFGCAVQFCDTFRPELFCVA